MLHVAVVFCVLVLGLAPAHGNGQQQSCTRRDCKWGRWSDWSECKALRCHPSPVGVMTRERTLTAPAQCPDLRCAGKHRNRKICRNPKCDAKPTCTDPNEYFSNCGPCPEKTCGDDGKPKQCTRQCKQGCFCRFGFVRSAKGVCIRASQCPKPTCEENEEYRRCSCQDRKCDDDIYAVMRCKMLCTPKCYCKVGYVRNSAGKCVLRNQCGKTCGQNEHYNSCGSACGDLKCGQTKRPTFCNRMCVPGCYCDLGHVRNDDRKCVRPSECEKSRCGQNEVFSGCGSKCAERKCGDSGRQKPCPFKCDIGCFCAQGYVRNEKGACVRPTECPKVQQCEANESFSMCGSKCMEPKCSDRPGPKRCVKKCEQGCFCLRGYFRNDQGACVKRPQCPKLPTCRENERYRTCGNRCMEKRCGVDEQQRMCPMVCQRGCFCESGFFRRRDGKCVDERKCLTQIESLP